MWQIRMNICRTTRPWFFICAIMLVLMAQHVCLSQESDKLSPGQSLSESQTLVSKDSTFELGFFPIGSTSSRTYLGIWYKDFLERTIVWVANRETPSIDSDPRLEISDDGNLVLLVNESEILWSTNVESPVSDSVEAVLLSSGNFVLRDALRPSSIFWQSFDHPTDTWLPGAKFGMDKLTGKTQVLTSWKNSEDPSPGLFSFRIDPGESNQYVMEWNMSRRYWSSGFWNGKTFSLVPELSYTYDFMNVSKENEVYFNYSIFNKNIMSRLVMSISGQLQQLTCLRGARSWSSTLDRPENQSDVYAHCGKFGILNKNHAGACQCLQGFKPFSAENTGMKEWSERCVRKTSLQCENNTTSSKGKRDGILKIPNVELPADSKQHPDQSIKGCELGCLRSCSCTAYAYNEKGCLIWDGDLLGVQQLSEGDNSTQYLYLKLAASDIPPVGGNKMKLWVIIAVLVSVTVLVSGGFICCLCIRKLKHRGEKNSSMDLLSYDFNTSSTSANDDETEINNLRRGAKKDVELPFFSFASVSEATSNFSAENKLGEGGFGPVYKGKSLNGQEIALKRLSKRSGQGLEEFRNEIVLIAKLQHRNLVRLLGCCIERGESILIYEYMPNKSLDFFIFDPSKKEQLDWETRIRVIEGIAQGLVYLHHYSRLRIIHRDLKASNILLDSEMNPKISDFGMARIFGGNESQANTKHIVGTYGYMAPEYAMEGLFSIKSDVFSFGVLLLEIVSGRKNTGFYHSESLNLLGHAWDLWISDRASELKDPVIAYPSSSTTSTVLLRYINIGLLCVQENPTDRPTMSYVVSMLSNDLAALPKPTKPAFATGPSVMNKKNVSMSHGGNFSVNGLTVSSIEPR